MITDFGLNDPYVGVMKAVVAGISPETSVIDLTHAIPPQDVQAAGVALLTAHRFLPAGSIVCVVVDPGVGSDGRALAVHLEFGDHRLQLVCPDNGIITPLLDGTKELQAVSLDNPQYHLPQVSATFHGHDIFAPASAHLAAGTPLASLGSALAREQLKRIAWPTPQPEGFGWRGSVLHIDHFGNLITTITATELGSERRWSVRIGDRIIAGVGRTFADAAVGEPVAYLGSSGHLEIARRDGDVATLWGVSIGQEVLLEAD